MTSEIGILEEKKKRSCAGCKGKSNLWCNICRRRAAGKPRKKPGQKGYPKTLKVEGSDLLRAYISESLMTEGLASNLGHFTADVAGAVLDFTGAGAPVAATIDLGNAGWYAAEGDYLFAALSLISALPVIGDAIGKGGKVLALLSKAGKLGEIVKKGGSAAMKTAKLIKSNKGTIMKAVQLGRKNKKLAPYVDKMNDAVGVFIKQIEDVLPEQVQPAGAPSSKKPPQPAPTSRGPAARPGTSKAKPAPSVTPKRA